MLIMDNTYDMGSIGLAVSTCPNDYVVGIYTTETYIDSKVVRWGYIRAKGKHTFSFTVTGCHFSRCYMINIISR